MFRARRYGPRLATVTPSARAPAPAVGPGRDCGLSGGPPTPRRRAAVLPGYTLRPQKIDFRIFKIEIKCIKRVHIDVRNCPNYRQSVY